jgi:hypothetical protein
VLVVVTKAATRRIETATLDAAEKELVDLDIF